MKPPQLKASLAPTRGQYSQVALRQQMCPALLMGPLRVKGIPTPLQHHPQVSLSLLPLSAPCQCFKGFQAVAKSCRSDKHPAPGALSFVLCAVQRTGPHNRYFALLSFQNISHPCPSWGVVSANAARLMTQAERAHPRHYRQWEHMNRYTLTCHSLPDRVQFVKHHCSCILEQLGKNFFHQ